MFSTPCFSTTAMCFPHWFWLSSLKPTRTVCWILNAGEAGWQSPERCALHFKLLCYSFDVPLDVRHRPVWLPTQSPSMFQVEGSWKMVPGELYFMIKTPAPTFFISKEEGGKRQVQSYRNTLKKKIQRKVMLAVKTCKIPSICQQSVRPHCSKLARPLKHL